MSIASVRRVALAVALTLAAMAGGARVTAADPVTPEDYAYGAVLDTDTGGAVYALPLPATVYAQLARADLADLCVVNGRNELVPFALRRPPPADPAGAPVPVPLALFPLREGAGTASAALRLRLRAADTSVEIDRPATGSTGPAQTAAYLVDARNGGGALGALRLEWDPATPDFSARIDVETSGDLDRWTVVTRAAPLVDLHFEGQQFVRADVPLPEVTAPYLRLTWSGSVPPVSLTGLAGLRVTRRQDAVHEEIRVAGVAGPHGEDYTFDLRGHYPIDRVNLVLPERNSVVEAEFFTRSEDRNYPGEEPWRSVARGRLYRLRAPDDSDLGNAAFAIAPIPTRYWRVRIAQAGGGLGAGRPWLTGGWIPDELLFVARGPPPFRLLYGNAAAGGNALAIPVEALLGPKGVAPRPATLEAPMTLGGSSRLTATRPPDLRRWMLWGVLVLAVAALGAMAWRLAKKL